MSPRSLPATSYTRNAVGKLHPSRLSVEMWSKFIGPPQHYTYHHRCTTQMRFHTLREVTKLEVVAAASQHCHVIAFTRLPTHTIGPWHWLLGCLSATIFPSTLFHRTIRHNRSHVYLAVAVEVLRHTRWVRALAPAGATAAEALVELRQACDGATLSELSSHICFALLHIYWGLTHMHSPTPHPHTDRSENC